MATYAFARMKKLMEEEFPSFEDDDYAHMASVQITVLADMLQSGILSYNDLYQETLEVIEQLLGWEEGKMMILMDSLDELYEIVDKTTKEDELVNDFTKVRVDVDRARNKLHLPQALMESKNLSEEEAMKALGYAPASVERCKQVTADLGQLKETDDKFSDKKLSKEEMFSVLDSIMTMGGGDDLQEAIEELTNEDPNGSTSMNEVFTQHTVKRIAKAKAAQNKHAVEYLMQSMNLDKDQAEAALGLDAE